MAPSAKKLKSASILLEAGAWLTSNVTGLSPKTEDFFTEERENKITPTIVDGLVERVKTNQLNMKQALNLLIPNGKGRGILFPLAKSCNWGITEERAKEFGVNFSDIVPRLNDKEH